MSTTGSPRSAVRLFAVYAVISAVAVLVIGVTLAASYRTEATRRGVAEGQAQARLISDSVVEPLLDDRPVASGLDAASQDTLRGVVENTEGVTRLRLRDLDGRVVFSSDGSGMGENPEDEALEAAEGEVEAELTRLNSDSDDEGPVGQQVVEVYLPLHGSDGRILGVQEVYLPYAPIEQDISSGLRDLYLHLGLGLAALYVILAGLSLATTRRLRQHAQTNAYLAEYDQLTGLPNRRMFRRRIEELSYDGRAFGAVALIDLDRFMEVNDSLGHRNGDELLVRLGGRIAGAVRPGDTVARLGGDEFGVVLARVVSEDEAVAVLERLLAALGEPLEIAGLPLTPEASIGFALCPDDGADPEALMQHADVAMYLAKVGHTGVVRYDPAQDDYDSDRLALVAELRRALDEDELLLHYQPKQLLADGAVTELEALIRWNHPRHGLLLPDAFLPVAEQTGLIDPLTDWVVARALAQVVDWQASGLDLEVAVNVSARNLSHSAFADRVLVALHSSAALPGSLIVEITETALLTDVERARENLVRMAAAGVPISVDDFGRGQTSLGYLSRLPLHELKIDRGFVTDLLRDEAHEAIVRSVVELSHNLGFVVVAEGVEDIATLERLRSLGCDLAQGYVLARPMPAADVAPWLAARRASAEAVTR
jgi:diguanylate cyclase (GGDEF)-like protein